ncbi:hypothetical protein AV530_008152 [Patagioenas fasciata monilis]|uniref:Uncharacterized protein n=1 Tax=Patagioenas fasciata monilis TaxID=372326 RepID=A0A1V4KUX1_PATFA|nr:hypothetical protein AV530_008152 [Patagioenas fasciata monilis]
MAPHPHFPWGNRHRSCTENREGERRASRGSRQPHSHGTPDKIEPFKASPNHMRNPRGSDGGFNQQPEAQWEHRSQPRIVLQRRLYSIYLPPCQTHLPGPS